MKVKYNRLSTLQQTGNRYTLDTDQYDLSLSDRISGSIKFRDRPEAKKLIPLVESKQLHTLVVEELSRLGRSTSDTINTLDWLERYEVNVMVRNIGLQSRPNGKRNAIWSMISAVLSSMYQMELEAIRERTKTGIQVYLQNGGTLGRKKGTTENAHTFLSKPKSQEIIKYLKRGNTIREIAKLTDTSNATVLKVKKLTTTQLETV